MEALNLLNFNRIFNSQNHTAENRVATGTNPFGAEKPRLQILSSDTVSFGSKKSRKHPPRHSYSQQKYDSVLETFEQINPKPTEVAKAKGANQVDFRTRYPKLIRDLRDMSGIPCAYCGTPMLGKIKGKELTQKLVVARGDELANVLAEHREYATGVKRAVVDLIAEEASKDKHLSLERAVKKLSSMNLKNLESEQFQVLKQLKDRYTNNFETPEKKKRFHQMIKGAYQTFKSESPGNFAKRKDFINGFMSQLRNIADEETCKEIEVLIRKLPTSNTSPNAFLVKYSRRGMREIAQQLFSDLGSTVEHIHPQSYGGRDEAKNLMLVCAFDNNLVRGNVPLPEFIKQYPETVDNIVKYLKYVKNIPGYEEYVKEVAKLISTEAERDFTNFDKE